MKWSSKPEITLIWSSAEYFNQITTEYDQILNNRIKEGSRRPITTKKLTDLDKEINKGINFIKIYLKELYGENDKSRYAQYGIVKSGVSYKILIDRANRINALELIIASLKQDGLNDRTYGKDFWENIRNQYIPLKKEAADIDKLISEKVSRKNALKQEIKEHLYALINVLKGNYPKTYKSELRAWGFQKEKY